MFKQFLMMNTTKSNEGKLDIFEIIVFFFFEYFQRQIVV